MQSTQTFLAVKFVIFLEPDVARDVAINPMYVVQIEKREKNVCDVTLVNDDVVTIKLPVVRVLKLLGE